jgi:hypothetical protein
MNKQTKTLLMVGGGVVVAYLIYKSMTKKDTTTPPPDTTQPFANAVGGATLSYKPRTKCKRSPEGAQVLTAPDGSKAYECCGDGIYGTQAGPSPCKNTTTTTTIETPKSGGRIFQPTSTTKIFK